MKLGIICFPSVGGSGIIATEIGHALARRGHAVHFISKEKPWRFDPSAGNVFFHTEIPAGLDLLHAHYAAPHAVQARASGLPYVVTLHGTDVTRTDPSPETYAAVRQARQVTVPSQYLKREAERVYGITGIEVIPNFVNVGRFIPGAATREPILMHASNFRPVKRIADVIAAFRQVKHPSQLVMVGDGPDRTAASDVTFLGERLDVSALLQTARVFLLPSESESFGVAALEAQAAGVPVVGSNIGGIPEVVRDGETGFLHPVGDTRAMAASVDRLLGDDQLWKKMSAAARENAVSRFSEATQIDAYEKMLSSSLSNL